MYFTELSDVWGISSHSIPYDASGMRFSRTVLDIENCSRTNKKSELMLMRCARAYSSSCSQVVLVYLHPFRRNSLFSSQKSLKSH